MPKTAAKKPTKTKTTPYDVAEHLRTPEEMAAYLDAWIEESRKMRPVLPVHWGTLLARRR